MPKKLTHTWLIKNFHYNPKTGIFKNRKVYARRIKVGAVPGWITNNGYILLCIKYRAYLAHRLAWFYMTKKWPRDQIDHRDRCRDNNRFSNLREASGTDQMGNFSMRKNNTSGFRGVSRKRKKWMAQMMFKGVYYSLGVYRTKEEAKEVYEKFSIKLRGSFYFSPSPNDTSRYSSCPNGFEFKQARGYSPIDVPRVG